MCIQLPRALGRGRPRRIMWRSAWFMRAARAKNVGTSVVYIGRRKRNCGGQRHDAITNERKRERKCICVCGENGKPVADGGESGKGAKGEEHLRVCAGSAQLAVTNGRRGRTEKVSVARFARVHLTKKSNIYFSAGARNIPGIYFFATLRPERKKAKERAGGGGGGRGENRRS